MIKKADHVLNNKFLIPSLSLLFRLYPFLFSLSSEQKTKKPNPRSPYLHRRQRRSTAGLYVRQSSSPQLALQDPASNRAFVSAESSFWITHTDFSVFWVFFFLYSSPIGWRGVIFVAACQWFFFSEVEWRWEKGVMEVSGEFWVHCSWCDLCSCVIFGEWEETRVKRGDRRPKKADQVGLFESHFYYRSATGKQFCCFKICSDLISKHAV